MIIGIDPDSRSHGVAVYINGSLYDLLNLRLKELERYFQGAQQDFDIIAGIENVLANNFVYIRNRKATHAEEISVALSVGRCQQAQMEVMRVMDELGIEYKLFDPGGGNWANNRSLFEKVTGWKHQSNKDTRSAAFFGYLIASR